MNVKRVKELSAAFDTVDHKILIERLQHWVGISGTALKWFCSYLTNGKFFVYIGDHVSPHSLVNCGVLQGSILGLILFSLYMLGHIIHRHKISFHCYTDDTQLYLPVKPTKTSNLSSLTNRLADIKEMDVSKFS